MCNSLRVRFFSVFHELLKREKCLLKLSSNIQVSSLKLGVELGLWELWGEPLVPPLLDIQGRWSQWGQM